MTERGPLLRGGAGQGHQREPGLPGHLRIVGDHDHRGPLLPGQIGKDAQDLAGLGRIQRGRGFVRQHDGGPMGQGSGDGHTLALAHGKACGHLQQQTVYAQGRGHVPDRLQAAPMFPRQRQGSRMLSRAERKGSRPPVWST